GETATLELDDGVSVPLGVEQRRPHQRPITLRVSGQQDTDAPFGAVTAGKHIGGWRSRTRTAARPIQGGLGLGRIHVRVRIENGFPKRHCLPLSLGYWWFRAYHGAAERSRGYHGPHLGARAAPAGRSAVRPGGGPGTHGCAPLLGTAFGCSMVSMPVVTRPARSGVSHGVERASPGDSGVSGHA